MDDGGTPARALVLALLDARAPDASVCPSEIARALASDGDWRQAMPTVHAAVDELLAAGVIRLSWKDEMLSERGGPYRIRRPVGD